MGGVTPRGGSACAPAALLTVLLLLAALGLVVGQDTSAGSVPVPSGESKKLSTVLKPGELPEGYQADFVITTLRVIIGSKNKPITTDFTNAIKKVFANYYSVFDLYSKIELSEPKPFVDLAAGGGAGLDQPAAANDVGAPKPSSRGRRMLQSSAKIVNNTVLVNSLASIQANITLSLTRDTTFLRDTFTGGSGALRQVLATQFRSFGYEAEFLTQGTALPENARIVIARLADFYQFSYTAFLITLVASPTVMDQLSPFVAAQTAILRMLTIKVPQLIDVNFLLWNTDPTSGKRIGITFLGLTIHPYGTFLPKDIDPLAKQPVLDELAKLGFAKNAFNWTSRLGPNPATAFNLSASEADRTLQVYASPNDPLTDGGGGGLTTGATAGVVVGAVVAVALIAIITGLFLLRRHRKRMLLAEEEAASGMNGWDAKLQGYVIAREDIEICKNEDGSYNMLGEGGYGRVFRGIRGGVQDIAIKQLMHAETEKGQQREHFMSEVALLKGLNYDRNIVQFYGVCLEEGEQPMLVCELMEGGDVAHAITSGDRRMGWYRKGHAIALDVARALCFLHSHNVVHGDIKSQNILLTKELSAKVGDVGLSRLTEDNSRANLCTLPYAAPEVLLGKTDALGTPSDVYSFGVLLHELATGCTASRRGALKPPMVPQQCPADVWKLIVDCNSPLSHNRPTARECFDRLRQSAEANKELIGPWASSIPASPLSSNDSSLVTNIPSLSSKRSECLT
mmetsp:Transcript_2752/g.8109  ORF Transcript_2752/g.8109 Transcript_2752/m.8109 type:complete len:738 (-) Transcript_2752:958-3171(-)